MLSHSFLQSVLECDFLNVDIKAAKAEPSKSVTEPRDSDTPSVDQKESARQHLKHLFADSYDTVVFSLLLSYLPSTRQRLQCCINAHRLLRLHGLLLIITPDSSHQNKHARMMKAWKNCIEALGFHRWRYIKDTHLHCMAFRKTRNIVDYSALASSHPLLCIPQDSQELVTSQPLESLGEHNTKTVAETFQELPFK